MKLFATGVFSLSLLLACGGGGAGGEGTGSVLPTITTQPTSLTVASWSAATLAVAATGSPTPTFTWQRSNDGGKTWADIPGAISATYSFTTNYAADNGAQFQAVAASSAGSAVSRSATLVVTPIISAIINCNHDNSIAYYLNGAWRFGTQLSTLSGTFYSPNGIAASNGNFYATGDVGSLTGYWINGNWNTLGGSAGYADFIAVSENNIYISGVGSPLGYWVNGNWVNLSPSSEDTATGNITAFAVSNENVYVGATLAAKSGNGFDTGYWLNGSWVSLVVSGNNYGAGCNSITIDGNNVYVGGYNGSGGYWLNGNWVSIPQLSSVWTLAATGSNVYALGSPNNDFVGAGPGYCLNGSWVPLPLPSGSNGGVWNLSLVGDNVLVGGCMNNLDGSQTAGYWLNGTWTGFSIPQPFPGDPFVIGIVAQ